MIEPVCLHHNQSQLLPSQLLHHVGQEPHLQEPQHVVLLLHIHQPFSSYLYHVRQEAAGSLAWLASCPALPYTSVERPSDWGSAPAAG